MHVTNPDSLRSCLCFRVFRFSFASDFFNLLLVRFHQAEIIIVKHCGAVVRSVVFTTTMIARLMVQIPT